MEIRLREMMPKLGWRGDMGRVVVSRIDEGRTRKPRVTGKIFWCCDRAFLTLESYQKHASSRSCKDKMMDTSDSDDGTEMNSASRNAFHNRGSKETPNGSGRGRFAKRSGLSMSPPKKVSLISVPLKKHGALQGNGLQRNSNKIPIKREVLSTPNRNGKVSGSSPSTFNVMSLINLGTSDDGAIILSCKECDFTAGETAVISEHIMKTHSGCSKEEPKDSQNPTDELEDHSKNTKNSNKKVGYTCELCNIYKTPFRANLDTHKKFSHDSNKKFGCKLCTCTCATKQALMMHFNRYHKTQTPAASDSSSAEDESSVKSQSRPASNSAACNLCGFTSYSVYHIERHKLSDHIPNGRFPCPKCSCVYDTRTDVTMHLHRVHNNRSTVRVPCNSKATDVVKPLEKLDLVDKWVEQTLEHQSESEEEEEEDNNVIKNDDQSNPDTNTTTKIGPFKCVICQRTFSRKCHLVLHNIAAHRKKTSVKTIAGKEDIKSDNKRCSVCQKTFPSEHNLNVHTSTYHVEGGTYKCPNKGCKCVMDNENSFKNHMRKCQLRTVYPAEKVVVKKETGEKSDHSSLTCDLCGFAANTKNELNLHLKDSHVICGVECVCGCSFATATELTHHKNNDCQKSVETFKIVNVVSMASPDTSKKVSLVNHDVDPSETSSSGKRRSTTNQSKSTKFQDSHDGGEDMDMHDSVVSSPAEANRVDQELLQAKVRCVLCDKWFKNEKGLSGHNAAFHSVYYNNCEICGSPTPTYPVYKSHKKACHVKDGIPCPECPCAFKAIEGLNIHYYVLHKGKLDKASLEIRCTECDYVTFKQRDMDRHNMNGHIAKPVRPPKETYKCEHCPYEGTSFAVECHIKTNHVENGFKCRVCSNSFATRNGLRTHLTVIHQSSDLDLEDDKLLHKCQLCEYTTTSLIEFERHSTKNHVKDGFKCDRCGNTFASESGLRGHIRHLHDRDIELERDYSKCKICDYNTGKRKKYKDHMKTCHVKDGIKCPECPCTMKDVVGVYHHAWMLHKIKIDKNDYMITCEYCDFKTLYPSVLQHHGKTAHSVTKPSKQSSSDDTVSCTICDIKMSSISLENHISKAHVEGGYSCPHCKCSFANQLGVLRHARARHGETVEFRKEWDANVFVEPCTMCDMRFKTKVGLSCHFLKKHGISIQFPKTVKIPNVRKRTCELCHAQFTESLAAHLKRNHVENGFKCLHCCCTYETFATRSRHMIKAHKVLLVKNCNICGNKFLGTIKKHMNKCHVSNGIPCDYCCCTFESVPGKNIHERRIHNSSKPKKHSTCDVCQFAISVPLEEHMKRCHVPNGVQCSYCPCTFQTEQGKIQHLKIRHKVTVSLTPTVCDLCGLLPLVPMRYHLMQSHVPNGIQCSHCSCCFRSELSKTRHLERYHNVKVTAIQRQRGARKCTLCGITPRSLKQHLRKHHVEKGYPCSSCSCSYVSANERRLHMWKAHKKRDAQWRSSTASKDPRLCRLCGQIVNEPMDEHMTRSHLHTNPHKCNQCVCRFKTSIALQRHIISQHKVSSSPQAESTPSMDENSEPDVQDGNSESHVEVNLEQEVEDMSVDSEPEVDEAEANPEPEVQGDVFVNSDQEVEEDAGPEPEGEDVDSESGVEENTFKSTVENMNQAAAGSLKIAPAKKIETRPIIEKGALKCSFCPRKFPTQTGLKIHVKHIHSSKLMKQPAESDNDDVGVASPAASRSSSTSTVSSRSPYEDMSDSNSIGYSDSGHSGVVKEATSNKSAVPKEKLTCAKCGYLASSLSQLNIHKQKSHVKSSPFPCTKCTCGFATAKELDRHQRVLHPQRA